MENSLKQEFTRRLSQCNNGEMIVIMYDIVFAYMEEAKAAYGANSYEDYKAAVKKSQGAIATLIGALDYKYDILKLAYLKLFLRTRHKLEKLGLHY